VSQLRLRTAAVANPAHGGMRARGLPISWSAATGEVSRFSRKAVMAHPALGGVRRSSGEIGGVQGRSGPPRRARTLYWMIWA